MWVNSKSFAIYVFQDFKYFTTLQKTWTRRMFNWLNLDLEAFSLDGYLENLALLGLVNFKQESQFVIKLVEGTGYQLSSFQQNYYYNLDKDVVKSHRSPNLAKTSQVKKLLNVLSGADKLFVAIQASSGRRGADIARIDTSKLSVVNNRIICQIAKDKCNNSAVTFSFKWDDSLNLDEEVLTNQLLSPESRFMFKNVNRQNISNLPGGRRMYAHPDLE